MSDPTRIEQRNDGQILYIALDPDGVWARSEFPHPLVTVDYDEDDRVIGISAAGPRIVGTLDIYTRWFEDGTGKTKKLVEDLNRIADLTHA